MNPLSFLDRFRSPPVIVAFALVLLAGGTIVVQRSDEASTRAAKARHGTDPHSSQSSGATGGDGGRAQNAYDGGLGFIVPYRPDCPPQTERRGAEPPKGFKEWCARVGRDEGIKHGWSAEWYPSGRPANAGEYEDGLRTGVWTRWYPSGSKRVQAQFHRGLQHGKLVSWDEDGNQLGEQLFEHGAVVAKKRLW